MCFSIFTCQKFGAAFPHTILGELQACKHACLATTRKLSSIRILQSHIKFLTLKFFVVVMLPNSKAIFATKNMAYKALKSEGTYLLQHTQCRKH